MAANPTSKASGLDIFVDMYKLNSEIDPDGVQIVHKSVTSDLARGLRKIERIERWTRERQIGRGGFGVVYLQRNTSGEDRAVKVLDKQFNASQKQDFLRELMHMAYFSKDQACFPTFQGWYEDSEKMYLAMEYFEFGDLKACLSHDVSAFLPELEVRMIISQVAEALTMLHAKGISHRDLKPTNVFVYRKGPNWWVKLGDFGISKRVQGDDTGLYTRILGPFVAPEINDFFPHDGEDTGTYTSAVDIWSLGCLAHWLLTRKTPFQERGSLHNYCTSKIKLPLGLVSTQISANGLEFLRRCLAVRPRDRFTAQEALESTWLRNVPGGEIEAPLSKPNTEPVAAASVVLPYRQAKQDLPTKDELLKVSSGIRSREEGLTLEFAVDASPKLSPRVPQQAILPNVRSLKDLRNPHASERMVDRYPAGATDATSSGLDKEDNVENNFTIVASSTSKRSSSIPRETPHSTTPQGLRAFRALSNAGMSVNSPGALIRAAERGHFYLIHGILSCRLASNLNDMTVEVPYWRALQVLAKNNERGSVEAAEALLKAGADPNPWTKAKTPLMIAAEWGNLEMTELLVQWGADVNHLGLDYFKQSPLLLAASTGNLAIAQFLLRNGADTDLYDTFGHTAMMEAAQFGYAEMTELLLAHGAKNLMNSENGQSPLILAAKNGNDRVIQVLIKELTSSREKSAALNLAAEFGHVNVVGILLDEGADVNGQAPDSGQTALHRAAAGGHSLVVQLLLQRGANSMIQDKDGLYPMNVVEKGPAGQRLLLSLI